MRRWVWLSVATLAMTAPGRPAPSPRVVALLEGSRMVVYNSVDGARLADRQLGDTARWSSGYSVSVNASSSWAFTALVDPQHTVSSLYQMVNVPAGVWGDESGKIVPPDVKAGDRILFGKWSGTEVKLDGDELLIMKETDIMGVIEA